jgi:hypothetical protein
MPGAGAADPFGFGGGFGGGGFPQMPGQANLPALIPQGASQVIEAAAPAAKAGFSIADLKTFIDRVGGIDGIVNTMTRVQKVVGTFQQMAPMVKLLMGTFLKKKSPATDAASDIEWRPKRRKRRKRRSTRRPGGSSPGSSRGPSRSRKRGKKRTR